MKLRLLQATMLAVAASTTMQAQTELYPGHFDLEQVTLLDGPMKTAMDKNFEVLMQYDIDRLLTPFVRQSGLSDKSGSDYYGWTARHPNFRNWGGDSNFDLSGHVGGHYLTALSLAYAACHDADMKAQLKQRLDYMVAVMKDCQDAYDADTEGLYGFIGGQPINQSWKDLYAGKLSTIRGYWGWVPFYVQHKILAGLRDAYIYGGNSDAREVFRKLCDWSVNVIGKVSDSDLQSFLDCEHGGMNESMLDAYQLFGDEKYLTAATRYTHNIMLNGMQTLNTSFLDGKHANTQVPKYIGMERIGETSTASASGAKATVAPLRAGGTSPYLTAAENFWTDVAQNRTVCIGGNSVSEHFLARASANRYIDQLDGPESCNSNNMLKLSEMMFDRTHDAKFADFYEQTMWNHILSTQDPTTGGYVYFTTLRPQGYRIYSQVNQGMWCCVGTGMENHSKYGHFIYTHDGTDKLYVNLFTPSKLVSDAFVLTQETTFPNTNTTTLTVGKAGHYTIAIRHPHWAADGYQLALNGTALDGLPVEKGLASYAEITRDWQEGDIITVTLPMELRYEECPGYEDYIAFKYGPILLAAQTSKPYDILYNITDGADIPAYDIANLPTEVLQNEYGGEGRMDHAPGSRASSKNLTEAPMLIGERADVLSRIERLDSDNLCFSIDVSRSDANSYRWEALKLVPFYLIHHGRYMCYWYQQTAENYANSTMAQTEAENEALAERTLDFVAPGEQQSEAGHDCNYSSDSSTGDYNTEHYRDAKANGYIQYTLYNNARERDGLSIMLRFNLADHGRKATLTVDGTTIADITIPASAKGSDANGFYNAEYPIPEKLVMDGAEAKDRFVVRLTASSSTLCPGIYYVRLLKGYKADANAYEFHATDWTTGDAWRVSAQNITYDEDKNIIHVNAGTGANNVALMMKYQELDYTISKEQTFLVVRGTNLKTTSGASYLWWLNGMNRGSQVAPAETRTVTLNGMEQTLVAWNMTTSGLYDNFTGDRPNVCLGMTIFGMTSTTGKSDIYDINFATSVEDYLTVANGITDMPATMKPLSPRYDLQGRRVTVPAKGIIIENNRKIAYREIDY